MKWGKTRMIGCQSFIKELSRHKVTARLVLFILLGLLNVFQSYEALAAPYVLNCKTRPELPPGFPSGSVLPSGAKSGVPYTGFVDRFIGCIEDAMVVVGQAQFATIRTQMRNTVVITIALFIIFFSYRIMFGNLGSSMRDNFIIMVFKLTGVSAACFFVALEHFFPLFIYAQQVLVQIMTSSLSGGPPCDGFARVWQRIDCSVGNMFGATLTAGPGNQTITPFVPGTRTPWILLSFVLSNLFSSVWGLPMLIVFLALVVFLLLAFGAATMNYLMSLLALVLLFLFAPVIIPLVLFDATKQMFDQWLKMLFSYTVQPMLLFAYLTFMMVCINYIVIGPGGAVIKGQPGLRTAPGMTKAGLFVNTETPIGMLQFLDATRNNINNSAFKSHKDFINPNARVEGEGVEECSNTNPPAPAQRTQNENNTKIAIPTFTFIPQTGNYCYREKDYGKCVSNAVFMNLLILLIMSIIMLAFMGTVIDFGNDLAGIAGAKNFANRFNANKIVAQRINKLTNKINKAVTKAVMALADAKTGGMASKVKSGGGAERGGGEKS